MDKLDINVYKNCYAIKNAVYISESPTTTKPCCFYDGGSEAKTWKEYQDDISREDISKSCKHCIDAEAGGSSWSHRLQYDDEFYHNDRFKKVFVIGVCFDNVCNIKCTTCSPANSSKWIEDYTKLNLWKNSEHRSKFIRLSKLAPEKVEIIKSFMNDIEFDTIRFDIYGGEPTINPMVAEFVDWLSELDIAKNIIISFTTNGTVFFERFETYLEKFRAVQIQLSIDGIEDHFEYLRYGAKWNIVSENIKKYDEMSMQVDNLIVSMHYTLSWMNSLHFPKYYQWVYENTKNLSGLHLTKVVSPIKYSLDLISPSHKKEIIQKVAPELDAVNLDNLTEKQSYNFHNLRQLYQTSFMNYSSKVYSQDFFSKEAYEMLGKLDTVRDTNFKQCFSEMIGYIGKQYV